MDFLGCYKWTFLGATNGLFRLQKMDFFAIKNGTPGVPGVAFTLEITVCFTHPGKNFSKFRGKTSPFFGVNKWTFWGLTNGLFGDSQMDFFGCYKWTFWGLTNGLFGDPQTDFLGTHKPTFGGPKNGLFGAGKPGRGALWCHSELGAMISHRFLSLLAHSNPIPTPLPLILTRSNPFHPHSTPFQPIPRPTRTG